MDDTTFVSDLAKPLYEISFRDLSMPNERIDVVRNEFSKKDWNKNFLQDYVAENTRESGWLESTSDGVLVCDCHVCLLLLEYIWT